MKNIGYLILVFLIFSCANKAEKKEMYKLESAKEVAVKERFTNEIRTKQKLQDYFDLLVLEQKNPAFKEAILEEIQHISSTNKKVTDTNAIQIQNLKLLGKIQIISDTVQKIKITFERKSVNKIKKDTINVTINTKKVIIDGKEMVSSKIRFLED